MKIPYFRIALLISIYFNLFLLFPSCTSRNSTTKKLTPAALIQRIDSLNKLGYVITDLHAHLKGGLTMDSLLEHSRITGIRYGVAANCGIGFPIINDSSLMNYYYSLESYPVYKGLQAEGREWINLFSPDSVKKFDYAFTDAMTFTDNKGRRMRLWMKDEVWVDDKQSFMDMLVDRITTIMENEPVNIYVNSTFLPDVINSEYDKLWTDERMDRIISSAVKNNIAIEINSRYRIPSAKFIKKAKAAGVKFTMGTNNVDANIGYLEYGLDMVDECKLEPGDFWQINQKH